MDQQKIVVLFLVVCFPVIHGDPNDFLGLINLTDSDKQQWEDTHNHFRRQVSNPEAANMKLMTWDDELAKFAEKVVKTCAHVHTTSGNRTTATFSIIGENLYTGGLYRVQEMMTIDGITKLWFDEVEHYNYTRRSCASGKECGHYTQVAWANTYKVGCAIGECSKIESGVIPNLVSCNYGPAGNLVYAGGSADPPYISGEACSQCESGDLCIDQLCSNNARDNPSSATGVPTTTPTTAVITTPIPTTTVMTEIKTFPPRTTASSTMTTSASTSAETNSTSSETNLTALATSSSYLTTITQSLVTTTTSGGSRNVFCSGFIFSIMVLLYIIVKI